MSANGDVMSFLQFSHPEAGTDTRYIKLTFSLRIAFYLTKAFYLNGALIVLLRVKILFFT